MYAQYPVSERIEQIRKRIKNRAEQRQTQYYTMDERSANETAIYDIAQDQLIEETQQGYTEDPQQWIGEESHIDEMQSDRSHTAEQTDSWIQRMQHQYEQWLNTEQDWQQFVQSTYGAYRGSSRDSQ